MHIVFDINRNQSHLLGSCRICAKMAKGTLYHNAAHALVYTCAGMMEYSFTKNSVIQDYYVYKKVDVGSSQLCWHN